MELLPLESTIDADKDINLLKFVAEANEFTFIVQKIKSCALAREEIFVLARTNRQLTEFSHRLKNAGISHVVKSDEIHRSVTARAGQVTLATIHAIKGLEAEMVFIMGCTSINFPCRGSDHPVIEMVKVDEYDKEDHNKEPEEQQESSTGNPIIVQRMHAFLDELKDEHPDYDTFLDDLKDKVSDQHTLFKQQQDQH